jgi:hypothetical protein
MQDIKQDIEHTYGMTTLHPVGLTAVLVLGTTMLLVPRRWAILPVLVMACFISPGQRLVLAGFDFDLLRLMVLFGWTRLLIRGELQPIGFKWLDAIVVLMAVVGSTAYSMLRGWDSAAITNRMGWSFDLIGMYFLFRFLVRDWKTLETAAVGFVVLSMPVALFFLIEWMTGRNVFAVLGGVREVTHVRGGRLRCQGAFAHPILAGCFWAALLPMMAALWWRDAAGRVLAVIGCFFALMIIVCCSSSTPLMSVIFVIFAACLFPIRHWMKWVFAGAVVTTVLLDLIMNKPVYHLLGRINVFSSSTGWHRFNVIDQAVRHFDEWWEMGIVNTIHWGVTDITNQYVLTGLRGGLLTMLLFMLGIGLAYVMVGRTWRFVQHDRYRLAMAWALGVALFAHTVTFISVSYFGQIDVIWYLLLATIASLAPSPAMVAAARRSRRRAIMEQGISVSPAGIQPAYAR